MLGEKDNKMVDIGPAPDTFAARPSPGFDILKPWKIISQNNIYIIYLSVLLFAIYAFSRYGFNWIALSTTLIVSLPVGFAIAFFETQALEFRRRHRRTQFWVYLIYRTMRVTFWFMVLFIIIMIIIRYLPIATYETIFPHKMSDFFTTRRVFEFLGIALAISLLS